MDEPSLSDAPSRIRPIPLLAAFFTIASLIGLDLVQDWRAGSEAAHLGLEAVAMAVAALGVAAVGLSLAQDRRRARAALVDARVRAEAARARAEEMATEAARWRSEAEAALRGLGAALDQQFARWSLSPAEREVALLLLKGLGTKEIATLRDTSDRTVRQQARAIYAKAGLAGRAELAAFFLENLLLPPAEGPARSP